MTRLLRSSFFIAFFAFLGTSGALAQTSGGSSGGGSSPAPSTAPSPSPSTNRSTRSPQRPDPFRSPMFVSGRVVSELGRAVTEPVSVELNCGMRPIQVIHTDLGGYFTFSLGTGAQSNLDFSASNESPQSFSNDINNLPNRYGNPLAGCELRLSVAGYRPVNHPLTHNADMGRLDVGSIRLERIGGTKGTAISLTSLMVPKEANKEFEKAIKDLENNKPDTAREHLEKAVAIYDKFAAAWNELGRLYLTRNLEEKAVTAFERSANSDPEYIPPLMNLATLQIQGRQWEKGVETAGKALALDADIPFANFLIAVANYNLHHIDEAEKSAKEAVRNPANKNPQVHALLAQIYMDKQDYAQAANHMRTYLQEAPDGDQADKMKKDLAEIEAWVADFPTPPPAQ